MKRVLRWNLCISIACFLLLFSGCAQNSVTEEPEAKPVHLTGQKIKPPQLDQKYYDFIMDMDGIYDNEALFPNTIVLNELRTEWEKKWLASDEHFSEWVQKNQLQCGLISAYTEDFDGNGREETFFTFGLGGGMQPTVGLYFMNSMGEVTLLDEAPYFYTELIRYPKQIQLVYTSARGAIGISQYGRIYGCKDGKAEELLYTDSGSEFYKDGCFVCALPRVGSAGSVMVTCSYWDEKAYCYQTLPCDELNLMELPHPIFTYAMKMAEELKGSLSRAGTVGGRYFYLEFDNDHKYHPFLLCRLLKDGQVEQISNIYFYSLEYITSPLGTEQINYFEAVERIIPVSRRPGMSEEERKRVIAYWKSQMDVEMLSLIPEESIFIQKIEYNRVDQYYLTCQAGYVWLSYVISEDLDYIQKK